ncbi:MAG: hypothetical protein ABSF29_12320 [Tepidisphaeraceae bacterium]|jgi:hypothetical protein
MSKSNIEESIENQWARLGAMFNVSASRREVDVERLLLETARRAAVDSRLFILAVTWLAKYGDYVAKHRLAHLILHELEEEHQATMGLMLDLARENGANNARRFNQAIQNCKFAVDERPLFDIDRRNAFFIRAAEKNASALSRKWGRWVEDFELKDDAIRTAAWIVEHNPSMRWRGDFKGGLRASILAELDAHPKSGRSESELARTCGATRTAIINAAKQLERSGKVRRQRHGKRREVHKAERSAA